MLYFLLGRLPWQSIPESDDEEGQVMRTYEQKSDILSLCEGLPGMSLFFPLYPSNLTRTLFDRGASDLFLLRSFAFVRRKTRLSLLEESVAFGIEIPLNVFFLGFTVF
jgi:hypothetical protein